MSPTIEDEKAPVEGVPELSCLAAPASMTVRKPWLTWTASALCVVVFVGIGLANEEPTWELVSRWGAPSSQQIWSGAFWGLVSSTFVHLALWHLAFNVYWLWILGGALEKAIGSWRWLMLFLGAAIVSSAAQLSVSGQTGIGMSGVLYAMFGFMWVARRRYPVFSAVVTQRIAAIFLVWLILCLALAKFADWQIGNAAHFGGLLFGALSGLAVVDGRRSAVPRVAAAALVLGSIASIFWCPWSFEWVASRAYAAHVREDYRAAVSWYRKCHRFDRQPVWVLQNLALAYAAMPDEEAAYSSTLDALREMSPEGVWEVEEEVARARSYCPAVDEPSR